MPRAAAHRASAYMRLRYQLHSFNLRSPPVAARDQHPGWRAQRESTHVATRALIRRRLPVGHSAALDPHSPPSRAGDPPPIPLRSTALLQPSLLLSKPPALAPRQKLFFFPRGHCAAPERWYRFGRALAATPVIETRARSFEAVHRDTNSTLRASFGTYP